MLQIRIENQNNPQVYRVVQIDPDQTLFDLEMVIETVFEIDEVEDDAVFEAVRQQGQLTKQLFYTMEEKHNALDADEEFVEDWFLKTGDEMLYHMENQQSLKITFEKKVTGELEQCIEGAGHLHSNRKKVDLDEINMELNFNTMLNHMEEFESLIDPDYETLLALSDDLKKLKPWQYFENEEIIALELAEFDETYFVSVMGAAGQEYGLMMYDEELGYSSLAKILAGGPFSEDFQFELSALTVNFVDRAELDKADYALIKDCGLTFRGKKNWIAFRTYDPGMMPEIPKYSDVEVMKTILQAIIEVTLMRRNGWEYPQVNMHEFPKFAVDEVGDIDYRKLIEAQPKTTYELEIEVNDIERTHIKRKQKVALEIEYDLFYLPYAVSENDSQRPVYPLLYVVLDRMTGEVLVNDLFPFPKIPMFLQTAFWEMLKEIPVRPNKVFVKKEMKEILQPVAKLIGIELVVSELPQIRELKEYMSQMPPV